MNNNSKASDSRYAPVVIPTLCRYEHFRNCVESLAQCQLADKTDLFIGLDYPLKDSHKEGYTKLKKYISDGIVGFKSVNVFFHEKNIGAINNSTFLYNQIKNKYDSYIYTEDDNVFSQNFLVFVNDCLNRFKEDESVYAVCGYCYPIDSITDKGCFLFPAYSYPFSFF